jgi:hypothetical protein
MRIIFFSTFICTLFSVSTVHSQATRGEPSVNPLINQTRGRPEKLMNMLQVRASFSNRTRLNITNSHGPQVTHTTADGKSFLWYPNNKVLLAGEWKLEPRAAQHKVTRENVEIPFICFKYGANTYNPATGSRGAAWECGIAQDSLRRTVESESGDTFGLSKRAQPPFVLTRDVRTFRDIKVRIKDARS